MSLEKKSCDFCGRLFWPRDPRRIYCSDSCMGAAFRANNPDYQKEWARKKRPVHDKECRHCGKAFQTTNSVKIFCCDKCKVAHFNATRKTTKHDMRICPECGKGFHPMQKAGAGRKFCTSECLRTYHNRRRRTLIKSTEYSLHRDHKWGGNCIAALKRDNYSCVFCGKRVTPGQPFHGKRYPLEVHHLDNNRENGKRNHDLDNLMTLCVKCHQEWHNASLVYRDGKFGVSGTIFQKLGIEKIEIFNT